jgi:hypothetical protein
MTDKTKHYAIEAACLIGCCAFPLVFAYAFAGMIA